MTDADCRCGHAAHHHNTGRECHTINVTGPASPDFHMGGTHPDRTLVRCGCLEYKTSPGTGDQVQTQKESE